MELLDLGQKSDKQTRKLDDEMNDIETEEKRVTPYDTKTRVKPINILVSWCPTAKWTNWPPNKKSR